MSRHTLSTYKKSPTPSYVVVWSMHWQVIECHRMEPAADLSGAMAATIERLASEGWQAEGSAEYGFRVHPARDRAAVADAHAARSLRFDAAVVLAVPVVRSI